MEDNKIDTNKIYMVIDMCMWEKNKQEGKNDPHAIGVVDLETGQTLYIKGGSKIKLVEGEKYGPTTQEDYNNQVDGEEE